MAYYMRQVFGNRLCVDALDVDARYLPSPKALRRKILVKVAWLCSRLTVMTVMLLCHILQRTCLSSVVCLLILCGNDSF